MFLIANKKILLAITLCVMVASTTIIATLGLNLGIDFTGGSLTEVSYQSAPDKSEVENIVNTQDLGGISVRKSVDETGRDAFLVQTRDLSEAERLELNTAVTSLGAGGDVVRFTSVGPVIGQELKDKAIYALFAVVLIIVSYVAFAFRGIGTPVSSWVYGAITIFSLVHDVLIATALMSVLGYVAGIEVDVLFVMALLAILGYSVNDTIVVFDRVRENLMANRTEKRTKREEAGIAYEDVEYSLTKPYGEIVGASIKDTLARSINTSMTTFVALVALYFIGSDATQTFALILMVGVFFGTYSSICIASPLVVIYSEWRNKKDAN